MRDRQNSREVRKCQDRKTLWYREGHIKPKPLFSQKREEKKGDFQRFVKGETEHMADLFN